jgi:hypothetical protein
MISKETKGLRLSKVTICEITRPKGVTRQALNGVVWSEGRVVSGHAIIRLWPGLQVLSVFESC